MNRQQLGDAFDLLQPLAREASKWLVGVVLELGVVRIWLITFYLEKVEHWLSWTCENGQTTSWTLEKTLLFHKEKTVTKLFFSCLKLQAVFGFVQQPFFPACQTATESQAVAAASVENLVGFQMTRSGDVVSVLYNEEDLVKVFGQSCGVVW